MDLLENVTLQDDLHFVIITAQTTVGQLHDFAMLLVETDIEVVQHSEGEMAFSVYDVSSDEAHIILEVAIGDIICLNENTGAFFIIPHMAFLNMCHYGPTNAPPKFFSNN